MRDLVIGIGIIGAVIGAVCAVSITTPLLVPLLKGSFLGGASVLPVLTSTPSSRIRNGNDY